MAKELEIKDPPWDKGECGLWHKPCKDAQAGCNLWTELPVTAVGPLGVPQRGMVRVCLLFAIFQKVQQPILVNAQAPNAIQKPGFHITGN